MKNLNSAKELDKMAQDMNMPESVAELELLAENIRGQIRTKMIEELQLGEKVVTFTKVNGEKRVMTCTLDASIIPVATKEDPLSQKKVRSVSDEVLPVWDVNAKGWRSFRIDSVVSFE